MKTFLGIAYNFFKTVKSEDSDSNKELAYAEVNIIYQEPNYQITNMGKISKSARVGEIEIMITPESAKTIRDSMNDILEFFESQI